jgi:signal transduction histidine kinase
MSRIPIRVRVAAAFAVAMGVVLAATGAFVYGRLGADLSHALDQDLRLRAQDLSTVVRAAGRSLAADPASRLIEPGESFAQLLDGSDHVLDATHQVSHGSLLTTAQVDRALGAPSFFDRPSAPGLNEPARLLAVPVQHRGREAVLVVGATRENRAEALGSLRTELWIAGPVALALATLVGYLLAGTGLRAVEAMRRRAAGISHEPAGERLPVPRTGDELQQLGETLNALLARLERTLARERGFVAEAGHELRTPLALMRAELDYALHYAVGEAELRTALRTASEETDRLAQLAGDLLLIASSDQGRLPLRIEPTGARAVLEATCRRFAWRAEAQRRPLVVEITGEAELAADRVRVEQAIGNLVDNALRHGAGTVTLSAIQSGDEVELTVRDQGKGFPAHFVEHAFERFSRAEDSRAGHGAGLGLSVVETIAHAHGGRALARNRASGGTEVSLWLPAHSPASRTPATASSGGRR